VEDLIFAADLLQHVMPGLRVWIAGDGPLRDRLEEKARLFRLLDEGRVRFLGHRNDVPSLLEAADLLVLPSRFEGLPNVVLEAMARSKPVVATAAPGTMEIVEPGVTGLLVPVGDRIALARAIRAVAEDSALAANLGRAGRERVERDFGLDAMIHDFDRLYENLAAAKGLVV
jgi:glycosyltransferase involved in cell wall biosynthesis